MKKRIFIVFGCLMLGPGFAYAGPVTSEPDAERGLALAERLCTNCHLVKADQEHANVDVPSFRELPISRHKRQAPSWDASCCRAIPCRKFRSPNGKSPISPPI
ncbi:MAG: hypothetical protein ACR2GC_02720 [Methyloceanibacter sp.]|uniref:hypothetical protein n=1 Tax=Methyloceanibacter sp. TaxID=1965321 RepID=UPI003D9B10C3